MDNIRKAKEDEWDDSIEFAEEETDMELLSMKSGRTTEKSGANTGNREGDVTDEISG